MTRDRTDLMDMVRIAAEAIGDKKGCDFAAFDVAGASALTDCVLIVSGLNAPHLKALVNETIARLKKSGYYCYRKSGKADSGWIIADYTDLMIHFFSRSRREYYGLDRLFEEAPELKIW